MIDALYARYSIRVEKPLDPNYKPKDVIRNEILLNKSGNKLAVIFPGWHTHNFPVNVLAKRLTRKGWAVLYYDFHDQILEPDGETVVESFRYIRENISSKIRKLVTEKPYREVRFFSISLGGVPMALVTDKFRNFTCVTSVVGGDNLAIDMWYGTRTHPYRVAFEKMHVGIRHLAKEWDTLSPDNHLRQFKGKPVKLIISKHDNFINTEYQEKLARDLTEVGAILTVKHRYSGHTITILRFCFFGRLN